MKTYTTVVTYQSEINLKLILSYDEQDVGTSGSGVPGFSGGW